MDRLEIANVFGPNLFNLVQDMRFQLNTDDNDEQGWLGSIAVNIPIYYYIKNPEDLHDLKGIYTRYFNMAGEKGAELIKRQDPDAHIPDEFVPDFVQEASSIIGKLLAGESEYATCLQGMPEKPQPDHNYGPSGQRIVTFEYNIGLLRVPENYPANPTWVIATRPWTWIAADVTNSVPGEMLEVVMFGGSSVSYTEE